VASKTRIKVTRENRPYAFVVAGIGTCFVAWASLFIYRSSFVGIDGNRYFSLFDDAMISMRYAWNLSHGWGLVWNPGEYVEGYTNPLMTVIMSLTTLVFDKVSAVLAIQILGIVFMLINAYLVMSIAKHLMSGQERYHQLFWALAFFCALSYYPLVYWSLMGMETGLLAVLLSLSILCALRYVRERRPAQGMLLSVSLGLAFFTRPDTVVFAVPIFVYVFYRAGRKSEGCPSLHFLFAMVGLYAMFIAGQELFRWGYYGEWLPNTYTLKMSGIPLFIRIENGIAFVRPFLIQTGILLVVVGASLVLNFRTDKLFLASIFAVALCYQVWIGGDPWLYWRILSPAMPIMLVLGVHGIFMALESVADKRSFRRYFLRNPILPRRYVFGVLAVLLMLAVLLSVNFRFGWQLTLLKPPYESEANLGQVNVALALNRLTKSEATVGVYRAGVIPYYTGRYSIDFLGKSDPRIAQLAPDLSGAISWYGMTTVPGHNKYDLNYSIKELKPTYVQGSFQQGGQDISDWAASEYVTVDNEGESLNLLKDTKSVRWDKIKSIRPCCVESGR
jgi:hypothetical protein